MLHCSYEKSFILGQNFHTKSKGKHFEICPLPSYQKFEKSDSAMTMLCEIWCFFPLGWHVYKLWLQEVQALWLFCKCVMSQCYFVGPYSGQFLRLFLLKTLKPLDTFGAEKKNGKKFTDLQITDRVYRRYRWKTCFEILFHEMLCFLRKH